MLHSPRSEMIAETWWTHDWPSWEKREFQSHFHAHIIVYIQPKIEKSRSDQWSSHCYTCLCPRRLKDLLCHLLICSGFGERRPNNHRIYTALLEILLDKIGDNTTPDKSQWGTLYQPPLAIGRILDGMASCKNAGALGEIRKVCARPGACTGKYNHIKSDIKWSDDTRIGKCAPEEYCFVSSHPLPVFLCLDSGDSGSFAFTDPAKWLGQVWGGITKQGADKTLSYVTDAEYNMGGINGLSIKEKNVI